MSFTSEGVKKVNITETALAEPKFSTDPNAFDVVIRVTAENGESDIWRGEVSGDYGKGNAATKTQKEMTMGTLHKLGFEGSDLTTLDAQLVGKETEVTVKADTSKKDGKVYYNVKYIGTYTGDVKVLDPDEAKRRVAAMMSANASDPFAATETPAQEAAKVERPPDTVQVRKNPFAKRT